MAATRGEAGTYIVKGLQCRGVSRGHSELRHQRPIARLPTSASRGDRSGKIDHARGFDDVVQSSEEEGL